MSQETTAPSLGQVDRKRRMSLKGPPLRVAMKQTAPPQPVVPPVSVARNTVTTPTLADRRQSLSARQAAKPMVTSKLTGTSVSRNQRLGFEFETAILTFNSLYDSVQQASQIVQTISDPIATVNARLDAMERQISELQSVRIRPLLILSFKVETYFHSSRPLTMTL